MSSFQDLPNELVSCVFHFVPPADLLAFALTSKSTYALTRDALNRHRELSKRYSLLEIGDCWDADDTHSAILLLGTILQEPDVAYHARSMHIGCCGVHESDIMFDIDEAIPESWQSIVTNRSAQLQQLVDECPFVSPDLKGSFKELLLQPGNEHGAVCLLLTLLPNLKHVHLERWCECSQTLHHIVGQIAEANQAATSPNHGKALSRLTECSMDKCDSDDGEFIDGYGVFAMLPSMRTLRGRGICRGESTELRPILSTVTEIEFTQSALLAGDFHGLLESIKCLKRFTFSFADSNPWSLSQYTPMAIIDVLSETASHSLELLDIQAEFFEADSRADEDEGSIRTLYVFTALKRIRLEATLFQLPVEYADFEESLGAQLDGEVEEKDSDAPSMERNQIRLEDTLFQLPEEFADSQESPKTLPDGEFDEEDSDASSMEEIQSDRLVDILPPSVTDFTLIQLGNAQESKKHFYGLADLKAEKLPNLKSLTFEHPNPLDEELKAALKAAGVSLWSWKNPL